MQKLFWLMMVLVVALGISAWEAGIAPAWGNQAVPPLNGSSGLITHVEQSDSQQITRVIIIDPVQRVMGVYHISRSNGEIQLKSVRNLSGDLQLQQFNSSGLSPAEINQTLERQ